MPIFNASWSVYHDIDAKSPLANLTAEDLAGSSSIVIVTFQGIDDRLAQTVHTRYSQLRHEVRDIVAEKEKVAVNVRAFFTKRGNGRIVQFDIAVFFTLREGRIARIREIMDTFDLVQQVLERDLLTGKAIDGS